MNVAFCCRNSHHQIWPYPQKGKLILLLAEVNLPRDWLFCSLKIKISLPIIRSGVFILGDQPWSQQSWEPALLYSGQSQCPLTCGWPLLGERVTSPMSILTPLLSHPFILFNQLSTSTIYSGIFQPPSHSARGQERHSKKFRAWLRMEKWLIGFLVNLTRTGGLVWLLYYSKGHLLTWQFKEMCWNKWLPGKKNH